MFLEVIVAPSYTEGALKMLSFKKDGAQRNVRVLLLADISEKQPAVALDLKKVNGGLIVQNIDSQLLDGDVKVDKYGKPYFVDKDIHINISH